MILHIVNQSPFTHQALARCLSLRAPEDSVLLIEDGVLLLANAGGRATLPGPEQLFVLEEDAVTRGLSLQPDLASAVDYSGFVDLVARHDKTLSWF
ncbi:MAG: sulfurtransferase complex subunit TusB [Pseudomonadota bacterium]|nr:sulfurtransferase complex subunit TusB [Pseudomonadales bacterium]MDY6921815.1 sulfurtransferase complex subunit TusB [Pseudomonadota bacterium]